MGHGTLTGERKGTSAFAEATMKVALKTKSLALRQMQSGPRVVRQAHRQAHHQARHQVLTQVLTRAIAYPGYPSGLLSDNKEWDSLPMVRALRTRNWDM